jgi:hypothetical protein
MMTRIPSFLGATVALALMWVVPGTRSCEDRGRQLVVHRLYLLRRCGSLGATESR